MNVSLVDSEWRSITIPIFHQLPFDIQDFQPIEVFTSSINMNSTNSTAIQVLKSCEEFNAWTKGTIIALVGLVLAITTFPLGFMVQKWWVEDGKSQESFAMAASLSSQDFASRSSFRE